MANLHLFIIPDFFEPSNVPQKFKIRKRTPENEVVKTQKQDPVIPYPVQLAINSILGIPFE